MIKSDSMRKGAFNTTILIIASIILVLIVVFILATSLNATVKKVTVKTNDEIDKSHERVEGEDVYNEITPTASSNEIGRFIREGAKEVDPYKKNCGCKIINCCKSAKILEQEMKEYEEGYDYKGL